LRHLRQPESGEPEGPRDGATDEAARGAGPPGRTARLDALANRAAAMFDGMNFGFLYDHFETSQVAGQAVVPLAIARGMDPREAQWMLNDHAQVRAYWASVNVAWNRILTGDDRDREWAVEDFWRSIEAQVTLLDKHAVRENDELFPLLGSFFDDGDDTMIMGILTQIGWANVGPFVTMVQQMEKALAAKGPAAVATPRLPIKAGAKAKTKGKRAATRPRAAR